jgi:hypothetical protein
MAAKPRLEMRERLYLVAFLDVEVRWLSWFRGAFSTCDSGQGVFSRLMPRIFAVFMACMGHHVAVPIPYIENVLNLEIQVRIQDGRCNIISQCQTVISSPASRSVVDNNHISSCYN